MPNTSRYQPGPVIEAASPVTTVQLTTVQPHGATLSLLSMPPLRLTDISPASIQAPSTQPLLVAPDIQDIQVDFYSLRFAPVVPCGRIISNNGAAMKHSNETQLAA